MPSPTQRVCSKQASSGAKADPEIRELVKALETEHEQLQGKVQTMGELLGRREAARNGSGSDSGMGQKEGASRKKAFRKMQEFQHADSEFRLN